MERIRRRGQEIVLGLLLVAAIVAGVTLILVSFSGGFSRDIEVQAELSQAGDALEQGDIVTYLNVIVGEVTGSSGKGDGSALVTLRIDPSNARQIPRTVEAIAVPASLFGNTKVELVPRPTDRGGPTLKDGDRIRADRSPAAEGLQTALANAYQLLTSVHPAQLDAALSALATALDGNGATINALVKKADDFLRTLAPKLPELDSVITSLATVTDHLARDAPSLLASLRNTLVVARGIVNDRQALDALLLVAPTALDNAQQLLNARTVDNIVTVLRNGVPVTGALAEQPSALADTIKGFKAFADAFNSALASGPYLKANLVVTGANFAELVGTLAGQQGRLLDSVVDPPEYTTADCPRYRGASGPNCSGASAASAAGTPLAHGTSGAGHQVLTTGAQYSGDSSIGTPKEVAVVTAAAESLSGVPASSLSPITADVLLGPLLRGTPTVINP